MKKYISEFFRRGFIACGIGPLTLAVLYIILNNTGTSQLLTVKEAYTGIISLAALAFIAGGMNVLYQIERLPLMAAIFIHGTVLYICYLGTYLINGWLDKNVIHVLVFTVIFVVGYLFIWAIIYSVIKRNTNKVNEILKEKREHIKQV